MQFLKIPKQSPCMYKSKVSTFKVQIFWEGHKNFSHLPLFIWQYLILSNYNWKMGQIFVAFSEYLNFKNVIRYHSRSRIKHEKSWKILKNLDKSWKILKNLEKIIKIIDKTWNSRSLIKLKKSWKILKNPEKSWIYFFKNIIKHDYFF